MHVHRIDELEARLKFHREIGFQSRIDVRTLARKGLLAKLLIRKSFQESCRNEI